MSECSSAHGCALAAASGLPMLRIGNAKCPLGKNNSHHYEPCGNRENSETSGKDRKGAARS